MNAGIIPPVRKWVVLGLLALAGCEEDESFPRKVNDAQYANGHPLSLNAVSAVDAAWEDELVNLTNQKRASLGLKPLKRNTALDAIGRAHSLHMVDHVFFDHLNPEGDLEDGRIKKFTDASFVARENIWIVEPWKDPQYVLDGFMASPGHAANVLSTSDLIGVGIVRAPYNSVPDHIYVTMEFVQLR